MLPSFGFSGSSGISAVPNPLPEYPFNQGRNYMNIHDQPNAAPVDIDDVADHDDHDDHADSVKL